MRELKQGDRVAVSPTADCKVQHLVGRVYTIASRNANDGTYELAPYPGFYRWRRDELKLIKENPMSSTKYYRIIKDHPAFELKAILSNKEDEDSYEPVDSIFYKDIEDLEGVTETAVLVEHQPDWFERVYPIGKLEKMAFGSKKQAQAAAAALYKEENK